MCVVDRAGPPILGGGGGRGDGAADTHTTQLLGLLGRVGNGLSLTQEQGWVVKKMRGFK